MTITTDVDNLIDESVEDNNQLIIKFDATEEAEETSFFGSEHWGFLLVLSSIMIILVIRRRKEK